MGHFFSHAFEQLAFDGLKPQKKLYKSIIIPKSV
jgi:hypothetical protein